MKTILVPLDVSDAAPLVIATAQRLALRFGARLILAHVAWPTLSESNALRPTGGAPRPSAASAKLACWQTQLEASGLSVEVIESSGHPAARIRELAIQTSADLIVVGSHGHGVFYEFFFGSTGSDLLKTAPCPVLIVPVAAGATGRSLADGQTAQREASLQPVGSN